LSLRPFLITLAVVCQLTSPKLVAAQGEGEVFAVKFATESLEQRMSVIANGAHPQAWLACNYVGADQPNPGTLYFCSTLEDFSRKLQFSPPEWFNAVAQHHLSQVVVWVKPEQSLAGVQQVLNHEIMHWALFSLPPQVSRQIPVWLHEGLAEMWADRGLTSTYQVSLAWESVNNRLPHLSSYKDSFGNEPYRAAVGYALAKEFVVSLRNKHGDELFKKIFSSMRAGRTFDQALIDYTGLSVVSHEQILRTNLKSWWRVVQEIYPHFFLLVVALILGLVPFVQSRRRLRQQALHSEWQREEDALDIWAETSDNTQDE